MKSCKFISNSENETLKIAENLAKKIAYPTIITLSGDLGAGKTVFSRGFAKGLGVEETVNSPTFPIVQEYPTPHGTLYHMDLYRISNDEEAQAFGIEDFLNNSSAISLIEWSERLKWLLPQNIITVEISHISENSRQITLNYPTDLNLCL